MKYIIGVSDMKVTNKKEDCLVTFALGSCIGVAIYDPVAYVGGILHYMLPESRIDRTKAEKNPFMFGDTGIPLLFETAYEYGAEKSRLKVILAGGASVIDCNDTFNIGKRNIIMARKLFWKNNVMISGEHIGGTISRTLYLDIESGKFWLTSKGERIDL